VIWYVVCQGLILILFIVLIILMLKIFNIMNKKVDNLKSENAYLESRRQYYMEQRDAIKEIHRETSSLLSRLMEKVSDHYSRNNSEIKDE
jgi:hypothetical protein